MANTTTVISSIDNSAEDVADRLNSQLPVKLSGRDVDKYPELMKLLTSLSSHLSSNGATVMMETERKEAEETLKHEKSSWFQNHILFTELHDLLLDQHILGSSTPSSHGQFYRAVRDTLSYAEAGDYLNCHPDPSSQCTLLGLSKEDLDRANPHRKNVSSLQTKLIPEIEQRLRKKGETLVNFHDTSGITETGKFAFAKASQLPAFLEAEKLEMDLEKAELRKDKIKREKQFWQYYQALVDSLDILEELIKKHRLQSQAESDNITADWISARCNAVCLKLKLLEFQLLCDTYHAETVQALSTIRNQLDLAIHETQQDLRQAEQSLQAYTAVGSTFDAVVLEYTNLKDEIDNKKWGLRELKHSLDTPGLRS